MGFRFARSLGSLRLCGASAFHGAFLGVARVSMDRSKVLKPMVIARFEVVDLISTGLSAPVAGVAVERECCGADLGAPVRRQALCPGRP